MSIQLSEQQLHILDELTQSLEKRPRTFFKASALGLTYREISFIFNVSERTVRRDIKKVKNILSKIGPK